MEDWTKYETIVILGNNFSCTFYGTIIYFYEFLHVVTLFLNIWFYSVSISPINISRIKRIQKNRREKKIQNLLKFLSNEYLSLYVINMIISASEWMPFRNPCRLLANPRSSQLKGIVFKIKISRIHQRENNFAVYLPFTKSIGAGITSEFLAPRSNVRNAWHRFDGNTLNRIYVALYLDFREIFRKLLSLSIYTNFSTLISPWRHLYISWVIFISLLFTQSF